MTDLGGRSWYIKSKNEGSDFTVELSGNLAYDAHFSWWILDSDQSFGDYLSAWQTANEPPVIETPPPTESPSSTYETSTTTASIQ